MGLTLPTASRNALADAVDDLVNAGSGPGYIQIRASTTVLGRVTCSDPAFGNASVGVITLSGTPLSGTATGTGTADNFKMYDSADVERVGGTVSLSGNGGDLILDNTSIVSGQTITITAGTITMPGS
jgi:hypothetical protein